MGNSPNQATALGADLPLVAELLLELERAARDCPTLEQIEANLPALSELLHEMNRAAEALIAAVNAMNTELPS